MKTGLLIRVVFSLAAVGWIATPEANGQGIGISGGGSTTNGGATVDFGPPKRTEPTKVRIEMTLVGKPREWTNTEGRKILATLVAFPKEAEIEGAKNAPLEILKGGNVRLLQGEDLTKVAEYPIEKLSEADQEFISNLALNIRLAADSEREKAEMEAEKKE